MNISDEQCGFLQSYIGLAGLWIAILGVSVYSAYSFTPLGKMTNENRWSPLHPVFGRQMGSTVLWGSTEIWFSWLLISCGRTENRFCPMLCLIVRNGLCHDTICIIVTTRRLEGICVSLSSQAAYINSEVNIGLSILAYCTYCSVIPSLSIAASTCNNLLESTWLNILSPIGTQIHLGRNRYFWAAFTEFALWIHTHFRYGTKYARRSLPTLVPFLLRSRICTQIQG